VTIKSRSEQSRRRLDLLAQMDKAYEAFVELRGNLRYVNRLERVWYCAYENEENLRRTAAGGCASEGIEFYSNFDDVVSSFRTKCKDFVFARGQEKKDLLTQLQSSASRPVQSSPSHNYPTYVCAPSLVSGLACAELVLVLPYRAPAPAAYPTAQLQQPTFGYPVHALSSLTRPSSSLCSSPPSCVATTDSAWARSSTGRGRLRAYARSVATAHDPRLPGLPAAAGRLSTAARVPAGLLCAAAATTGYGRVVVPAAYYPPVNNVVTLLSTRSSTVLVCYVWLQAVIAPTLLRVIARSNHFLVRLLEEASVSTATFLFSPRQPPRIKNQEPHHTHHHPNLFIPSYFCTTWPMENALPSSCESNSRVSRKLVLSV